MSKPVYDRAYYKAAAAKDTPIQERFQRRYLKKLKEDLRAAKDLLEEAATEIERLQKENFDLAKPYKSASDD